MKGGDVMRNMKNVDGFVILGLALLVLRAGVASAGVPAPRPEGAGPHPPHQIANLGHFQFENGEIVKDFKVAYVTHGNLSPQKDNVILVLPQTASDHHAQDFRIGPGKALDTDKYYIVAVDMLGCTVARQDTTTGPTNSGLKMDFPRYTIRDAVNVEHKLLKEYLGIDRLLAAIGGSYGGLRAFQFAVSYPTFVRGIISISGPPWSHPETNAVHRNMMDIITLDSGWYGGRYETNPHAGVTTALASYWPRWYSNEAYVKWFGTPEQLRQHERFVRNLYTVVYPQDARDVYYQLQGETDFNVGDTPGFKGDTKAALQSIKAEVLLIMAKEDLIVQRNCIPLVKEAVPKVTYVEIDSLLGHCICCSGYDREANTIMDGAITKFLARLR
jgi:homoserine O-acetyltransferase/O-succinyltransferase